MHIVLIFTQLLCLTVCIMQLYTCASRCLSTPYSISTNPGLISSQLVATVTEIDGSGTTCSTSPGDYTISRMRQLTTQCCRVINNMLYFTSHYAMQSEEVRQRHMSALLIYS